MRQPDKQDEGPSRVVMLKTGLACHPRLDGFAFIIVYMRQRRLQLATYTD